MNDWKVEPLAKHLASIESGCRPKGGVAGYTDGVPSLSAEQIREDGTIAFETVRYIPNEFFAAAKKGKIQKGDILVVKDGATTGKTAFINEDFPFTEAMVNEHTFILRTKPTLLPKFAFFCLRSEMAVECFTGARDHGIIGGLTQTFPEEIEIPVPPLAEQRRLVARIEALTSRLEQARQARQAAIAEAEHMLAAAISSLLERRKPKTVPLQTLLLDQPRNGWSPPAIYQTGDGTPVLTLSAVTGFNYDGSKVKLTSAPTKDDAHYWLQRNELLITRSNTPELVGHAAIYDGTPARAICCDLIMKMKVNPAKADVRFVHYCLRSPEARQFITQRAKGASGTMQKIAKQDVQEIPIPEVPVAEQRRIVSRLDALAAKQAELRRLQTETEAELAAFTSALLAKAFRGEL